jgi:tRNA dimethylallyltransferase
MLHPSALSAILIAGPTASGKSALALRLAEELRGTVINADSMQVYRDLRIITARPTPEEEVRAPHLLYGHRDAAEHCSVGHWLSDAVQAIAAVRARERLPIFVGGTGLYFKALTQGLAAVPPTPPGIRAAMQERLETEGVEALHAELSRRDPAGAGRLSPRDRTRVTRALEVIEATGRPLSQWHREGLAALVDPDAAIRVFLAPGREALYARIDARFSLMLHDGALEEVRALAARQLDPLLPAMKAHGVPWLIRHLNGEMPVDAAADAARKDTRHYAKRQFTWFRHQLPDFTWLPPGEAADFIRARFGVR